MEQQFSNRSAQQTQPQHVYSNPPYTVYASQPSYISASYQAAAQPQQINYQQSTNRYTTTRQIVTNQNLSAQIFAAPTNNPLTQRRITNTVGSTGGNNMLSQGGTLSGVPSHQRFSSASETSHAISATPIHAFSTFTSHNRQIPAENDLQELPLRMVVDAKYVGAIIGQGGSSIREITRESKARCVVDVQKAVRDPLGNAEKVISILGQPESCSRACMRILEVVRREMEKDGSLRNNDYELKLRAHNQLVGRLIGKGGATIKRIMEETGAVVFVSNDPATSRDSGLAPAYAAAIYPPEITLFTERTITIKGQDINTVFAAEQKISQKLRQSYESDINSRTVYSYGQATGGALPLMSPLGCPDPSAFLSTTDSSASAHITRLGASAPLGTLPVSNQQMHTVRMWVPNTIVGALIGPKGINIRNVMRITGANVRIEGGGSNRDRKSKTDASAVDAEASDALADKKEKSEEPQIEISTNDLLVDEKNTEKKDNVENEEVSKSTAPKEYAKDKEGVKDLHPDERLVIITGNEHQQYKAQYWIHQRVAEQTYTYPDSLRLCTEVSVPSKIVGRIVGKGGQNVRELQRATGAQVKIPEDSGEVESHDTTIVRVLGNFRASQAVQARLAQLTRDFADKLTLWSSNGQANSGRQALGVQRDSTVGSNDLSSNGAKSMEFNSRS